MNYPIEAEGISRSFGSVKAVDNISFHVKEGEVFGLLGPNGAGKTTTIRIILQIYASDSGTVSILGGPMTEAKKERIGYMPEERGLYTEEALEPCLVYLATLKGLSKNKAKKIIAEFLEQFDLADHKDKKIKNLSRGMQQKAQIINTLCHTPELIIVDEPFSGLDPVNTQMVKDILHDLNKNGSTIVMSTHMMHQVEEMCDRILLINQGRSVLYGDLDEIRDSFTGHAVLVRVHGELPSLPGVADVISGKQDTKLILTEEAQPEDILKELMQHDLVIQKFEIAVPDLDEIFVRVVKDGEKS